MFVHFGRYRPRPNNLADKSPYNRRSSPKAGHGWKSRSIFLAATLTVAITSARWWNVRLITPRAPPTSFANAMNRELEAYWRGMAEGKAQERYDEARRSARTFGRDYAETAELANRSKPEVLERLEKLERLLG